MLYPPAPPLSLSLPTSKTVNFSSDVPTTAVSTPVVLPAIAPAASADVVTVTVPSSSPFLPLASPLPARQPVSLAFECTGFPVFTEVQAEKWAGLEAIYSAEMLARYRPWTWERNEFLPTYIYAKSVVSITDVWVEWASGWNNYLPVQEITNRWANRWRRNIGGLKSEGGRRQKIINLIIELADKPHWNVSLALDFLKRAYAHRYTARTFYDYLIHAHGLGLSEVRAAAEQFL